MAYGTFSETRCVSSLPPNLRRAVEQWFESDRRVEDLIFDSHLRALKRGEPSSARRRTRCQLNINGLYPTFKVLQYSDCHVFEVKPDPHRDISPIWSSGFIIAYSYYTMICLSVETRNDHVYRKKTELRSVVRDCFTRWTRIRYRNHPRFRAWRAVTDRMIQ